jgi:hypothetical protein
MAVGDVKSDLQSIAAAGFLSLQPGAGEEWVIHNIYHESKVELYFYDGSNSLLFDADTGLGVWAWYEFHVTNSKYIRVKNTDSVAKLVGYDGVQTK